MRVRRAPSFSPRVPQHQISEAVRTAGGSADVRRRPAESRANCLQKCLHLRSVDAGVASHRASDESRRDVRLGGGVRSALTR